MATTTQSIGYSRRRQTERRREPRFLAWLTLALIVATPCARAFQTEHPISGRRIAGVMGVGGADWLERHERDIEEHPDQALDALGLKPGMVVADVGAGTGYMSLRMARRVAPGGKVFACDIQPEMLRLLRRNIDKAGVTNVETVLGTETDPKLPGGLDLILLVDVYHEFSQPQQMLRKMREALKPDGRLVLLEYRKEDPAIPIRPEHKMSAQEVKLELGAEGFEMSQAIETLPRQHIFVMTKKRVD